jgi:hypothetical protein
MDSTGCGSEDIARSLIRAMIRRRMYDLPQRDARLQWWLSRAFPDLNFSGAALLRRVSPFGNRRLRGIRS